MHTEAFEWVRAHVPVEECGWDCIVIDSLVSSADVRAVATR